MFPPSDSDDEPAEGGYYIIEGNARSPPPDLNAASTASQGSKEFSVSSANLIPPSPARAHASLIPASPKTQARAAQPQTAIREEMAVSDSDEEMPQGGYEVRVSAAALDREARNASAKAKGKSSGGGLGRKLTGRSGRSGSLSKRLLGNKEG